MASGLLLALGVADLAVLNLVLAPRLGELGAAAIARSFIQAAQPAPDCPAAPAATVIAAAASVKECPPAAPAPSTAFEAVPDIVFDFGQVQVPGGRSADIKRVADVLRAREDGRRLVVRGHADRVGSANQNLWLSRQRADNVLRLLKAFGAPTDQVSVEAAGDAEPASPNDTPLGWARNRRVQLLWR
jgi:outer membrane protein OmpA-like peptidoglycan-associated protein